MEFFALMLIPLALYMAALGYMFEFNQKEDQEERKHDEQGRKDRRSR